MFSDYFFEKFQEWEKRQKQKRSSYSAFAIYLSKNSFNVQINQQLVSAWINNIYKPSSKFIPALAEKLGPEIYDTLNLPRPDPLFIKLEKMWDTLDDETRLQILKLAQTSAKLTHPQTDP